MGKRAVVVGASMAGMLAVRVLRDYFAEVLVLERDSLPEGPEERRAVPQAHHIHLLLAKGAEVIHALLPGVLEGLEEAGACRYVSSADFRWYQAGQLAKLVDGPWQAATGDELQYKQTEGVRPPGLSLINWYMGRVVRLSATDPYVQLRFLRVMHMLAPGPSLFAPRILWRVLTAAR